MHKLSCIDTVLCIAALGRQGGRSSMNNQEGSGNIPSLNKREIYLESEQQAKTWKICF